MLFEGTLSLKSKVYAAGILTLTLLNSSHANKSGEEVDNVESKCSIDAPLLTKEISKDGGGIKHDGIDSR